MYIYFSKRRTEYYRIDFEADFRFSRFPMPMMYTRYLKSIKQYNIIVNDIIKPCSRTGAYDKHACDGGEVGEESFSVWTVTGDCLPLGGDRPV